MRSLRKKLRICMISSSIARNLILKKFNQRISKSRYKMLIKN